MSETSILLLFLLSMFFIPMICIGIHEYYLEEKEKAKEKSTNYYNPSEKKCKRLYCNRTASTCDGLCNSCDDLRTGLS